MDITENIPTGKHIAEAIAKAVRGHETFKAFTPSLDWEYGDHAKLLLTWTQCGPKGYRCSVPVVIQNGYAFIQAIDIRNPELGRLNEFVEKTARMEKTRLMCA